MNYSGGTVTWELDADDKKFDSVLDRSSTKARQFGNDLESVGKRSSAEFASNMSSSFSSIADGLGSLLKGISVFAIGSSIGFGAATKAAFDQVRQVENATFALKAYETNADKVNQVLSQLVAYARSDLGVLFQRQDLFDAASTLKVYGDQTDKLVGHVKILSKGVAIGKTNFQELSEILGQVIATGEVTSDTFEVLARRGIKLPDNFRNAAVSADQLFEALDKALPDSLLEGRANTIDGAMIRLQSSFRDLGGAILGVDTNTSKFIKGGFGDILVKSIDNLRTSLRDPAFVASMRELGASIATFATQIIPLLLKGIKFIGENFDTLVAITGGLVAAFVAAKVAAIGLSIYVAIIAGTFSIIPVAVAAAVFAIAFLQIKFGILTKTIKFLEPVLKIIGGVFSDLFKSIGDLAKVIAQSLEPALKAIAPYTDIIKKGLIAIGIAGFAPLLAPIALFIAGLKLISLAIGFVVDHFDVFKKILVVAGAIMLPFVATIVIIKKVFEALAPIVSTVIGKITEIAKAIIDFAGAVVNFMAPVLNIIKNLFIIYFAAIALVVTTVLGNIKDIIVGTFNFFWTIIKTVMDAIIGVVTNSWNTIYSIVTGVINKIISFFAPAWNWLYQHGRGIIGGLVNGIQSALGSIWNVIQSIGGSIAGFFKGAGNWLYQHGRDMIQGLINGANSLLSKIAQFMVDKLPKAIQGPFKKALGISSPSKVFKEYGLNTVQGYVQGINAGKSKLEDVMSSFSDTVTAPSVSSDMQAAGSSGTGQTPIEVNQNIYNDVDMEQGLRDLAWRLSN